jgi:serine/threonine protein kinase
VKKPNAIEFRNQFSSSSLEPNVSPPPDQVPVSPQQQPEAYEFPFKVLYIVMEYCGSMTLRDFINMRFGESNEMKIKLIRGIL